MKINRTIWIILKIYLLVLSIFSIYRIILFLTELGRINFEEVSLVTIAQSFIMGVRFDIVISGYILFIPAFVLLLLELFRINSKIVNQFFFYWVFVLFTIAFAISAADVPYFNQFFDRFSIGAFEWIENIGFVTSMIVQEPKYFLIAIPFIVIEYFFYKKLKKIFSEKTDSGKINFFLNTFISILFLSILFLGIRGRINKKSPIRVGTAYFSDHSFLNKLGLNPVFTLMRSYIDNSSKRNKKLQLIDHKLAVENVQGYMDINTPILGSPIARSVRPDTAISSSKPNIVLIIMESMSAAKMSRHGNKKRLTPFLDSLSNNSLYFDNIYTSGKHTFNGVFSTLFSFPALYRQHPMKKIQEYDGMSSTLAKHGYSTTYFTTHDSQFDNVEGFLRANDFQNVYSEKDFPSEEIKTALGVPDDFLFRYSLPKINDLADTGDPFFVTFMTASDHGPYYIPDHFTPKETDVKSQIVEYADWSLQLFIYLSSKEKWFDNTIFVFIADHGAPIDINYDIALNYFHTPLIFYAPEIFQSNQVINNVGSQIDVYPTLMGLTNQAYVNNTLGIDLLRESRRYAILNDDDKIGIIDSVHFCIMKDEGKELSLYNYREKDKTDRFPQNKSKALEMANYAKSNMQVYQNMLLNKETKLQK